MASIEPVVSESPPSSPVAVVESSGDGSATVTVSAPAEAAVEPTPHEEPTPASSLPTDTDTNTTNTTEQAATNNTEDAPVVTADDPSTTVPPSLTVPTVDGVVEVESAPASDAMMLQALDAAAAAAAAEAAAHADDEEPWDSSASEHHLASVEEFEKTLQSDVNENQALLLLCDVQACDPVFRVFIDDDLERLARYLSVLSFDSGERIISKGEPASFCGIVLSGRFHAVLNETTTVPLVKGAIVGEMSYYEGGVRTADIVSAEPSVLAVISFSDLRRLQPFEAELVAKFLHMLAVVSIRKLRNMMATQATTSTSTVASPTAAQEPTKEEEHKEDTTTTAPTKTTDEEEKKNGALAPSSSAASGVSVAASNASAGKEKHESLFEYRLKRRAERAAEEGAAALEEAKKRADDARRRQMAATRKGQVAMHKATTLEAKLRATELESEDLRRQMRHAKDATTRADHRVKLANDQIVAMTDARATLEKQLSDLASKLDSLRSERDQQQASSSETVLKLQVKVEESTKSLYAMRQQLDTELAKSKSLSQVASESQSIKEQLQTEHRSVMRDLDSSRASNMGLHERIANLDALRLEFATRLNDEELAHASWRSKAELYLGDYTRLTLRVREMESAALEAARDRRLTLRTIAQLRNLLKHVIVRSFVRNARTRKLIFAILRRVSQVVTARIDKAEADALSAGTSSDGAEDSLYSLAGSQTQTVSASQSRKDRAKLLTFLRADRTPVSRLIWLLDEEITNFESPFQALHTENTQLRHTLDAFFKRNIQLCQQFLQAKQTYEALHKEYARLRDAYEQIKRKEKANGFAAASAAAAAAAGGGALTLMPRPPPSQSGGDDEDESESVTPPPSFAATLPTPQPFTPISGFAGAHHAAVAGLARSPEHFGQISLSGSRASTVSPSPVGSPVARKGRFLAAGSPTSAPGQSPTGTTDSYPRSPRPPPAQAHAPLASPSRASSRIAAPRPGTAAAAVSSRAASIATRPTTAQMAAPVPPPGGYAYESVTYDISSRAGGTDVASRSEALRLKIQSATQPPRPAAAAAHPSWYGTHANAVTRSNNGGARANPYHQQQSSYPHAYALRTAPPSAPSSSGHHAYAPSQEWHDDPSSTDDLDSASAPPSSSPLHLHLSATGRYYQAAPVSSPLQETYVLPAARHAAYAATGGADATLYGNAAAHTRTASNRRDEEKQTPAAAWL